MAIQKLKYSLLFLFCLQMLFAWSQNQLPNIIVIVSDDAGYADIQPFGHTEIRTPAINKLTEEGVKFTNAYVTASVCGPSRAGLMTGRYQQRFGFEHNLSNIMAKGYTAQDAGLDTAETTMAKAFRQVGYSTVAIGKWHLGELEKYTPLATGFDDFYGFRAGHRDYFPYKTKPEDALALYNNREIVPEDSVTYLTDMFTSRAIRYIENRQAQPFFMYLAYNAVHTPLQAKKKDTFLYENITDSERQTYDAMLHAMDDGIGRIMDCLKKNNMESNTLIFFINDNGGATNNASDNGIYRGMKGSKWEGGIRVGFSIKWPGYITPGIVYSKPVSALDIFPTALKAAGVTEMPADLDGVNLLPYIETKNNRIPHKILFWKRGAAAAVRKGDWKLIRSAQNPPLLFNLKSDPSETYNLASVKPRKVKMLLHRLSQWERTLIPAKWYSSMGTENQIKKHRMEVKGRNMEKLLP